MKTESIATWATWMFFGPSSCAIDWASARSACFAPAKAEWPLRPRTLAVAPGKQDRSMAALKHALGDFAAHQEAGEGLISQTLR